MRSELENLYQEVILDHYKRPRNFGPLTDADRSAQGHNPLCGDEVKVEIKVRDGRVEAVHFEGSGCAISTASASLMTEAVVGKSLEEVAELFEDVHRMLTESLAEVPGEVGKLAVLSGVRAYPVRVKCATLAWHTLKAALEREDESVSTE